MKLSEVDYQKSYEYVYLYKRMWKYVQPYLFRGILGILMAIPVGLLDSVPSLAIKFYFDYVINGKDLALASKIVLIIPFAIVGFAALQGILMYLNNYLNSWTGQKITIELKKDLFEKLLKFEPAFYDKNSSGIVMMRFLNDPDGACGGIITNLKDLLSTVCSSIALVGVLIYTSWQLSIFAIFVLVSSFIPVSFIKKLIRKVSHESMKIGSNVNTNFYETFNGNRIINSFNLQKYQFEKFFDQLVQSFNLSMGYTKRAGWLSPAMYLVASVGIAGVMWYGNYLVINKTITTGSLFAFITALILLYKPVRTLGNTMAGMQTSFVCMNRVVDLFDVEPSIKNHPESIKIDTIKNSIKFENVWFEYEENTPILKGINFEVKIGDSLALVGNSGGGKTTIANLIPRFYDVKSGSIKIDGIDLRDIELKSLRQNISVVFQDNFLFSGTIKNNILLGKFNATDEEILKALKDSYLDEFIVSLPEGINTEIGERGVRLSGGQKQRLAIARAMVKNAPVVILDEATSALDNKSEAIVQKALDKLMENRTVIVIAHRLSTIQNATRIAVVNHGEIVEIGPHNELMKNSDGAYSTLYNAQFKFKEDLQENLEELQEV
ncbi:MAG: ABC transporter, ATP-binding cassette, subfamily B, bacterial MsbA [Candidatus Peregrinibacteria bacterium GW2011_GWC2_33_13]|nr:MAG: ABC transporter, ATP-binding cassette, subfamily B, bacterial MsbA [Candidatus Peregrinibacteria bacterium GW2011_GWC2_33_13]